MKCQSCGKKDANVKYYEEFNGQKQTLYLCEMCAKNLGFSNFMDFSSFFSPIFTSIPEFNLLEKKKCSRCGYTIDNYLSTGLFGCENCYKVFSDNVDELLYKINGKCNHIKINEVNNKNNNLNKSNIIKNTKSEKISELKNKLDQLIKDEKYEEAAIIRDKIKALKKDCEE